MRFSIGQKSTVCSIKQSGSSCLMYSTALIFWLGDWLSHITDLMRIPPCWSQDKHISLFLFFYLLPVTQQPKIRPRLNMPRPERTTRPPIPPLSPCESKQGHMRYNDSRGYFHVRANEMLYTRARAKSLSRARHLSRLISSCVTINQSSFHVKMSG